MNKELTKDIIQWDTASWSKALNFWEKKANWKRVQNGLEIGGREGGLSLWLALKGIETLLKELKPFVPPCKTQKLRQKICMFIIR